MKIDEMTHTQRRATCYAAYRLIGLVSFAKTAVAIFPVRLKEIINRNVAKYIRIYVAAMVKGVLLL